MNFVQKTHNKTIYASVWEAMLVMSRKI